MTQFYLKLVCIVFTLPLAATRVQSTVAQPRPSRLPTPKENGHQELTAPRRTERVCREGRVRRQPTCTTQTGTRTTCTIGATTTGTRESREDGTTGTRESREDGTTGTQESQEDGTTSPVGRRGGGVTVVPPASRSCKETATRPDPTETMSTTETCPR